MEVLKEKIYVLLFIILGLFIIAWFASNTTLTQYSILFLTIGLISFSVIVADIAIKEFKKVETGFLAKPELLETWVYERSWFTALPLKKPLIIGLLFVSLLLTSGNLSGKSIFGLGSVTFQGFEVVVPGPFSQAFVSGIAGAAFEEPFFRAIIPVLAFSAAYYIFHESKVAAVVAFFAVGLVVFYFYHWAVYGPSDIIAGYSLIIFSAITLAWVFLTKNIIFPIFLHFFNNFFIKLAGFDVPSLIFTFFTSMYGVLLMLVVVGYVVWTIYKKRKSV